MFKTAEDILKAKKFPSIILIFGDEEFLVEKSLDKLLTELIKDENDKYNYDNLNQSESSLANIVDIADAFPMMSERRVVVVKNFDKFFKGRTSKKNEEFLKFEKFLTNPLDTTVMILIGAPSTLNNISKSKPATIEKNIKSAKFPYDILLKEHICINHPKIYESEYPAWVLNRVKEFGKTISREAADLLIANSMQTIRDLNNEIEKLNIFLGESKSIGIEEVNRLVGANREFNVFELQKAVGKRDLNRSLKILFNMLSNDRQEMLIISMLTRYFTTLWKILEEQVRTRDKYQLAGKVGISPFFVPEYQSAARRYSPIELDRSFVELCEADEQLKTTGGDNLLIMQKMLTNIILPN